MPVEEEGTSPAAQGRQHALAPELVPVGHAAGAAAGEAVVLAVGEGVGR